MLRQVEALQQAVKQVRLNRGSLQLNLPPNQNPVQR